MSEHQTSWFAGLNRFGLDDSWVRGLGGPEQRRRIQRHDLILAVVMFAFGILSYELMRSALFIKAADFAPEVYATIAAGTGPLALRRRFPLTVAVVLSLHMFITGLTQPEIMMTLPMQMIYFFSIFNAVAWARDRRLMVIVLAGILLLMFGWIAWQLATSSGVDGLLDQSRNAPQRQGLFTPVFAYAAWNVLINAIYFGGAIIGGQAAWNMARRRALVEEQAETIHEQSTELRQQAVVAERLRIARELHDVVAHHVSVIGIQAGAARKNLSRNPDVATESLRAVETSSRDAVAQMRSLLGTLRAGDSDDQSRAPEPTLSDFPALIASAEQAGLRVIYNEVAAVEGALGQVPDPVAHSLYRTAQEALANIRRHSTATQATVTLRVDPRPAPEFAHGFAEVEVIDNGRPRAGTSGTGLGLLGVRERLGTHGGVSEIGPRATGGYRVRVRMPLPTS